VRVARRESRSQAMVPIGGDEPALLVAEEPDRRHCLPGRDRRADGGSLTPRYPPSTVTTSPMTVTSSASAGEITIGSNSGFSGWSTMRFRPPGPFSSR
jgi:hypothetical protein